jgi:CheY-like chemotaxis protein
MRRRRHTMSLVRRRDAARRAVLVVDDGAEARELYAAYLEYHGLRADTAEDGPSGIAKALERRPDAIVLDFSMPGMDGREVLERLKQDERTCRIPVVMVTAIPELVDARVRASCAAFLEKPCHPDRLLDALAAVLAPRAEGRPAAG